MDRQQGSAKVGVVQCWLGGSREENLERTVRWVRAAAQQGAQIVLCPELFEGPYFPREQWDKFFASAAPVDENETIGAFRDLARELEVVLPVSFFERDDPHYYNSVAMIDADGSLLGVYRKNHIPQARRYNEKFYFRPGNTGFRVWTTRYGRIGVGICWDQWFPECARAMCLDGAELLLYPTTIGYDTTTSGKDSRDPWQRVMIGHAVANSVPVAAANRTGVEGEIEFYGSSFIADPRGDKLRELTRDQEGVAVADLDYDELRRYRADWAFFRDRRPATYAALSRENG